MPPGGRVVEGGDERKPPPPKKKGPDPIKDLKKKMDSAMRDLGKDTEAVRKKLSEQAMEAQVCAQKAADDAVRAAGGETKRDKLERLFASDAEEVPTDENLSEFERHISELSAEDSMYKALMVNQQAQELDPEITVEEK